MIVKVVEKTDSTNVCVKSIYSVAFEVQSNHPARIGTPTRGDYERGIEWFISGIAAIIFDQYA